MKGHFQKQGNLRYYILILFIMVKRTTNVTHVESHFLEQDTYRHISMQSIMVKKITNLTLVDRDFVEQET